MEGKERKSQDARNSEYNPVGSGDKSNDALLDVQYVLPALLRRSELPCFTNDDGNVSKAGNNPQNQEAKRTPRRCFKSAI